MSNGGAPACAPCAAPCAGKGLCGGMGRKTFVDGLWGNNPIAVQVLGICSTLATTSRMETALVMGVALVLTTAGTNFLVSLLREHTPRRVRMIFEIVVVALFVMVFDQVLKAFYWDMSKQLGPYVGLIITNCIPMGRAEAFALKNPPVVSAVDGFGHGLGYAVILAAIGAIRELLGAGTVLGCTVLSESWYTPNHLLILAPGAFFSLAMIIGLFNHLRGVDNKEKKP